MKHTSLSNLASSRVFIIESGNKKDRIAAGVDLVVDRSLREERALTCSQGIFDEASTVFFDESSFHRSAHEVKDLSCPGMGVGSVHATRSITHGLGCVMDSIMCACLPHLTNSHSNPIGEQGGEVGNVRGGEIPARVSCCTKARSEVK